MGRISIDDVDKMLPTSNNNDFGFFSLKNNKERAVVRFLHNTLRDVEVLAVHYVKDKDGKTRAVSCLRGVDDPLDVCPICASGQTPLSIRYYFHMLAYRQDPQTGEWVGEHRAFDRGRNFSNSLETIASIYNPLHKVACVIERIGDAKSRDTTYNVLPLPLEDNDKYPYYEDDLDFEPVLGNLIPEKTADEMRYFLANGEFLKSDSSNSTAASAAPRAAAPTSEPAFTAPRRSVETAPTVEGSIGPRRRV